MPPSTKAATLLAHDARARQLALAYPVVEFAHSPVYHLVQAAQLGHTWCGTWAAIPYTSPTGDWIEHYRGGAPFPIFRRRPTRGRRLCRNCRKVSQHACPTA